MKIELDTHEAEINIIKSYSADGVIVKNTLYQDSLVVSPGKILETWAPPTLTELRLEHFNPILELSPEIILLGTGSRLRFPARDITDSILALNIGVEVMDTGAACRAYNFLAGEGRLVIAALYKPAS